MAPPHVRGPGDRRGRGSARPHAVDGSQQRRLRPLPPTRYRGGLHRGGHVQRGRRQPGQVPGVGAQPDGRAGLPAAARPTGRGRGRAFLRPRPEGVSLPPPPPGLLRSRPGPEHAADVRRGQGPHVAVRPALGRDGRPRRVALVAAMVAVRLARPGARWLGSAIPQRRARPWLPLGAPVVVFLGSFWVVGGPRYRAPLDPFIALLAGVALAAAWARRRARQPPSEPVSLEDLEVIRRAYEAYARGDMEAAAAAYSKDNEWDTGRLRLDEEETRGMDELAEGIRTWRETWRDHFFEVESPTDAGDTVVVVINEGGVGRTSGAHVRLRYGQIVTLRDGKIVKTVVYRDPRRRSGTQGSLCPSRRGSMRTYVRALGKPASERRGGAPASGIPGRGGRAPLRRAGGDGHPLLRGAREVDPEPRAEVVADAVPVHDQPL